MDERNTFPVGDHDVIVYVRPDGTWYFNIEEREPDDTDPFPGARFTAEEMPVLLSALSAAQDFMRRRNG